MSTQRIVLLESILRDCQITLEWIFKGVHARNRPIVASSLMRRIADAVGEYDPRAPAPKPHPDDKKNLVEEDPFEGLD